MNRRRKVHQLSAFHSYALKKAGFHGDDEVVPGFCDHCGPVWLPAGFAGDAWRVPACPWCKACEAGVDIRRPPVDCGSCQHFLPELQHSNGERGKCGLKGGHYRSATWHHQCREWTP